MLSYSLILICVLYILNKNEWHSVGANRILDSHQEWRVGHTQSLTFYHRWTFPDKTFHGLLISCAHANHDDRRNCRFCQLN